MPKQRRAENKGLPSRWVNTHGAFYYRVPPGQERAWDGKKTFRLGKSLPEAYREFAKRVEFAGDVMTINQLLDRYSLEVVPAKAISTQKENHRAIALLRPVFGEALLHEITPQMVYQYIDRRGAPRSAKLEIEVLSHAFTKAVKWGRINAHPLKGQIEYDTSAPRTRYVEDWEILECLSLDSKRRRGSILAVQAYIRLKLLTGLSRGDLLRLQPEVHFKDDGIHVQRHKTKNSTGKRTIYEWSDELRLAVEIALAARAADVSTHLFCNRLGKGYLNETKATAKGWDALWHGFMERLLKETKVTERFTEHDLRAKVASDADSLERARALLQHADARMTARVYRRKPERVKPAK
jgi:integrase